jgi:PAS domain S-box-containing protein
MNLESAQVLQSAFFSMHTPAAILDEGLRFTAVSNSFTAKFEYTAEQIVGLSAEVLYDSCPLNKVPNPQCSTTDTRSPEIQLRRTIRTRSGRALDSSVWITSLPGVSPPQYVALYQNVIETHRKEHELLSRAEMFRLIVENSPLPISVQDQSWRLILVNQAYCDFTGYERAELLGRDPGTLLHPPEQIADLPAQRRAILSLSTEQIPQYQVIRELVRRDGTRVSYVVSLGFTRSLSGESMWCGTLVDLRALDGLRAQLAGQPGLHSDIHVLFERFSNLSDDGIAIVERDKSRIVSANEALSKLLEVDASLLVGAPVSWLWEKVHPDDIQKISKMLAAPVTASPAEVTIRMHKGASGEHWIRLRSVSAEESQFEYFLLFEDITQVIERREARERQTSSQLEAIVAEVHHRIKNHLQGLLWVLPQRADVDPQTNAILAKAATQIAGIAEVHSILMQSPKAAPLTSMVIAIANAAARPRNASIEINAMEHSFTAHFIVPEKESVPLALIVNELVSNAIKHSGAQEPVLVVIQPAEQSVNIRISNVGKIPPNFDFDSLPAASGLGLVRRLFAGTSTRLLFSQVADRVVAELELSAPVVVKADPGDQTT